jgi:hypothetical protein
MHRAKHSKYRNVRTEVDGIKFDSKKEAARYQELKLMERAGEIYDLVLQPAFAITVNGLKVCTYKADFRYNQVRRDQTGMRMESLDHIVEDVKGVKTDVYKLKKKLVKACHGIDIREV